jgi:hypothetical protein
MPRPTPEPTRGFILLTRGAGGHSIEEWWVRRPTVYGRNIPMAAALSRGALRWIRLPARKRAVWVGCQTARVLTPPPEASHRQGVFCGVLLCPCSGVSSLLS